MLTVTDRVFTGHQRSGTPWTKTLRSMWVGAAKRWDAQWLFEEWSRVGRDSAWHGETTEGRIEKGIGKQRDAYV